MKINEFQRIFLINYFFGYNYILLCNVVQIKAGLVMCVLCNAVLLFSINTWGYTFFDLGTFPEWASHGNNCTVTGAQSVTPNATMWPTEGAAVAADIFTSTMSSF